MGDLGISTGGGGVSGIGGGKEIGKGLSKLGKPNQSDVARLEKSFGGPEQKQSPSTSRSGPFDFHPKPIANTTIKKTTGKGTQPSLKKSQKSSFDHKKGSVKKAGEGGMGSLLKGAQKMVSVGQNQEQEIRKKLEKFSKEGYKPSDLMEIQFEVGNYTNFMTTVGMVAKTFKEGVQTVVKGQ